MYQKFRLNHGKRSKSLLKLATFLGADGAVANLLKSEIKLPPDLSLPNCELDTFSHLIDLLVHLFVKQFQLSKAVCLAIRYLFATIHLTIFAKDFFTNDLEQVVKEALLLLRPDKCCKKA